MEEILDTCVSWQGIHRGDYRFSVERGWIKFEHQERLPRISSAPYIVAELPIDFHCHGIGRFDFSEIEELDLDAIELLLQAEGVRAVLTVYLAEPRFEAFCDLVERFGRAKRMGSYPSIVAFALEGPLLISPGGTPRATIWGPSKAQWERLAALGEFGLLYVVMSPDIEMDPAADLFVGPDPLPSSLAWIAETLMSGGVRPALGHFRKSDPEGSAAAVRKLAGVARRRNFMLLSDHLLNDMPRHIKHAWRTADERKTRTMDLAKMDLGSWTAENLIEKLGPVPGALILASREGILTLCLNFDGEHVDLEISARLVGLLGADNMIGMTDRIESRRLGGRALSGSPDNNLLYQNEGVVAAGTQAISRQLANAISAGVPPEDVWKLFCFVPARSAGCAQPKPGEPPQRWFIAEPGCSQVPRSRANAALTAA